MPSGPKKRKAAKKKQVKYSNNSNSSSTTNSHHGENDGGELSSPAAQDQHNHQNPFPEGEVVEVEKPEDNSSRNTSITTGSTEKAGKEEEGDIEIDKGSNSRKSHDSNSSFCSSSSDDESRAIEKKVGVLESAPVVDLVQPIESLPEKIAHKAESLALETSPVLDPVKCADSPLEAVSHVYDDTKIEEKPLVLELDRTFVVNRSSSRNNCSTSSVVVESVLRKYGAARLPSSDENAASESKDNVAASSNPTGSVSGVNGADGVNEPETSQYSDKPPLIASGPQAVQASSWKSCCGMLELFSSSDR